MGNPIFVANENKPLVTQYDNDYDNYNDYVDCNTIYAIRVDVITYWTPSSTDK